MGIMLVYDISSHKSYESINKWLRNIETHANESVEKILVGNKCDLDDRRQVSFSDGEAIARSAFIPYIETSAKSGENVNRAFEELTRAILRKNPGRGDGGAGAGAGDANLGSTRLSNPGSGSQSRCC